MDLTTGELDEFYRFFRISGMGNYSPSLFVSKLLTIPRTLLRWRRRFFYRTAGPICFDFGPAE